MKSVESVVKTTMSQKNLINQNQSQKLQININFQNFNKQNKNMKSSGNFQNIDKKLMMSQNMFHQKSNVQLLNDHKQQILDKQYSQTNLKTGISRNNSQNKLNNIQFIIKSKQNTIDKSTSSNNKNSSQNKYKNPQQIYQSIMGQGSLKQQFQQQIQNQNKNNKQQNQLLMSNNIDNIINRKKLSQKIQNPQRQSLNQQSIMNLIGGSSHNKDNKQSQQNKGIVRVQQSQLMNPQQSQPILHQQMQLMQQQQNLIQQQQNTFDEVENSLVGRVQFNFHHVVGKGGFGKVWKVEDKKQKKTYAMKEMQKVKVISKKSVHSVMNERNLLSQICNPFLVNMQSAFQDKNTLYLVMDYLPGGDLRYHIGRMRRFSENQTKYFIGCLLLGLYYLHKNNVIHRDIKPENLVLDRKGYMRITDLGIARIRRDENSQDTSGTPGYMAPEVMCRQNHSFGVDYFAMGVIIYEFMLGKRPYYGRSRKEIRDQMLSKQVQIRMQDIPDGWNHHVIDLVNRLLQRKPENRIGYNGIEEIMSHPWFRNLSWQKLENKELLSPYLPNTKDSNFDQRQLQSIESEDEQYEQNKQLLNKESVQKLFGGYDYEIKDKMTRNSTNTIISTGLS